MPKQSRLNDIFLIDCFVAYASRNDGLPGFPLEAFFSNDSAFLTFPLYYGGRFNIVYFCKNSFENICVSIVRFKTHLTAAVQRDSASSISGFKMLKS